MCANTTDSISDTKKYGDRNAVERVFTEIKHRTIASPTVLASLKQKLLTTGSDRSAAHGTNLFEYKRVLLY
jgi:hypothetical protein